MRSNTAKCLVEESSPEYCENLVLDRVAAVVESVESAGSAGLRYIMDTQPGIKRRRAGKGFTYIDPMGKRIQNSRVLKRINSLRIPPAWKNVWISPIVEGHIQATGLDKKGRKQYIYHPSWRAVRDQTKFNRMVAFGAALPKIRERTEQDLSLPGLKREKVLATVVRLLERTLIRIGNKEYVRQNQSFGLTTMHNEHIRVSGEVLKFHFKGKSGKEHTVEVNDKRLARIVKKCRELPGQELFQYIGDDKEYRTIDSSDVNEYLKEITNEQFTAKDFRTWGGTVHAAIVLSDIGAFRTDAQAKKNLAQAVKRVAEHLGNKPSICRQYYIHPAIIDAYVRQRLLPIMEDSMRQRKDVGSPYEYLQAAERAVLSIIQEHARESSAQTAEAATGRG